MSLFSVQTISPTTNLIGRPSRSGPESDLVINFLDFLSSNVTTLYRRTILIESLIVGSRPDIIVVDWLENSINNWPIERLSLTSQDLKLLHFLYLVRSEKISVLENKFTGILRVSLDRLIRAEIINVSNGYANFPQNSNAFIAYRITTFEAKISAIKKAIEQSFRNTWFSSHSFVLLPKINPSEDTLLSLSSRGIGLWLLNDKNPIIESKKQSIPGSFGSWLLNEIIWSLEYRNHHDI